MFSTVTPGTGRVLLPLYRPPAGLIGDGFGEEAVEPYGDGEGARLLKSWMRLSVLSRLPRSPNIEPEAEGERECAMERRFRGARLGSQHLQIPVCLHEQGLSRLATDPSAPLDRQLTHARPYLGLIMTKHLLSHV